MSRASIPSSVPDCAQNISQNARPQPQQENIKKESLLGGIVGALLGSLLGVLSIIILSQLGYIAALSGVLMAICTLKGYELLGQKLSTRGIVICCVLMLLMTYFGDRLDWAILVSREFAVGIGLAYQSVPLLLSEGVIVAASYWGNLALVYLFVLLGSRAYHPEYFEKTGKTPGRSFSCGNFSAVRFI